MSIILAELISPQQYQAERQQLFPSMGSLKWFMRQRREQLATGQAIVFHAGRWLVHPASFDRVIVECSRAAALRATQDELELRAAA